MVMEIYYVLNIVKNVDPNLQIGQIKYITLWTFLTEVFSRQHKNTVFKKKSACNWRQKRTLVEGSSIWEIQYDCCRWWCKHKILFLCLLELAKKGCEYIKICSWRQKNSTCKCFKKYQKVYIIQVFNILYYMMIQYIYIHR